MPNPSPSITRSLGIPPRLAPFTDQILAHVHSLGGYTPLVLSLARSIRPKPATIVELACGKGHLAVRLASIGQVVAIDAHRPFIISARNEAKRRGITDRCRFKVASVRSFRPAQPAELACMIGLLPAAAGARLLRRLTAPQGHYLIDDCVRLSSSSQLRMVPTPAAIRASLRHLGDTIVDEVMVPETTVRDQSASIHAAVARALSAVVKAAPSCQPHAREFLDTLEHAGRMLAGPLRPGIWLVQRGI